MAPPAYTDAPRFDNCVVFKVVTRLGGLVSVKIFQSAGTDHPSNMGRVQVVGAHTEEELVAVQEAMVPILKRALGEDADMMEHFVFSFVSVKVEPVKHTHLPLSKIHMANVERQTDIISRYEPSRFHGLVIDAGRRGKAVVYVSGKACLTLKGLDGVECMMGVVEDVVGLRNVN